MSASPCGAASFSRLAGRLAVDALCVDGDWRVVRRDLVDTPPSVPDAAYARAMMRPAPERDADDLAALVESDALVAELDAADAVLIDTPMNNYTVPAVLKAWIDLIVRPGLTFHRTAAGKTGMLRDRPVMLLAVSGGPVFGEGGQPDYLTPYLRDIFRTVGMHDFRPLLLDGLRRFDDAGAHVTAAVRTGLPQILSHLRQA
jgi:FMN-dependent NADH-azoreductase